MAAKNQNGSILAQVRTRLDHLRQSRDRLRARQEELAAASKSVALEDPERGLAQLGSISTELQALPVALGLIDEQEAQLTARLKIEQDAERERNLAEARARLDAPRRKVVAATLALQAALDEYQTAARQVASYGGTPSGVHPDLGIAVQHALHAWKVTDPSLLGLPPNPSPTETAIAETKADIARLKGLLAFAQQKDKDIRSGTDVRHLVANRKRALRIAEDRLSRLHGREPAPLSSAEMAEFGLVERPLGIVA